MTNALKAKIEQMKVIPAQFPRTVTEANVDEPYRHARELIATNFRLGAGLYI